MIWNMTGVCVMFNLIYDCGTTGESRTDPELDSDGIAFY